MDTCGIIKDETAVNAVMDGVKTYTQLEGVPEGLLFQFSHHQEAGPTSKTGLVFSCGSLVIHLYYQPITKLIDTVCPVVATPNEIRWSNSSQLFISKTLPVGKITNLGHLQGKAVNIIQNWILNVWRPDNSVYTIISGGGLRASDHDTFCHDTIMYAINELGFVTQTRLKRTLVTVSGDLFPIDDNANIKTITEFYQQMRFYSQQIRDHNAYESIVRLYQPFLMVKSLRCLIGYHPNGSIGYYSLGNTSLSIRTEEYPPIAPPTSVVVNIDNGRLVGTPHGGGNGTMTGTGELRNGNGTLIGDTTNSDDTSSTTESDTSSNDVFWWILGIFGVVVVIGLIVFVVIIAMSGSRYRY